MVIGVIAREVFKQAFRGLYKTVNFQDRLIDKAWSAARFNRSVRRGVRHGAGIGAATGYFISREFEDDIEDVFQTPRKPSNPQTYKQQKTRYRRPRRFSRCEPNPRNNYRYDR